MFILIADVAGVTEHVAVRTEVCAPTTCRSHGEARSRLAVRSRDRNSWTREVLAEERGKLVERDEFHPIIKVNVPGSWHYMEFLRFRPHLESMLAENP